MKMGLPHAVLALALTVPVPLCAGFVFKEDFSVIDSLERPYGIEVDKTSHYSHGHGRVIDGRYAILLHGNRHRLAVPALSDFRLEAGWDLETVIDPKRTVMGFKVLYRLDRFSGECRSVELARDRDGRLSLSADGRELGARENASVSELRNCTIVLEIRRESAHVETCGFAADFAIAGGPAAGSIAFDATSGSCEQFYISRIALVSPETPQKQRLTSMRFHLPAVQGFQEPLSYDVSVNRYRSGETEIECELSGGVASRGKRLETGGGEWAAVLEKIQSPYLRLKGSASDARKLYLWNGERMFSDPEVVGRERALPCPWPLKRRFFFGDLSGEPAIAAGYEHAICSTWRFAANGPYEQIRDWHGKELYLGESLFGGTVATVAKSPADKLITKRIPADIPRYDKALAHAKREHYFYESEQVSFVIETCFDSALWQGSEISVAPRFTDIYGKDLPNVSVKLGNKTERAHAGGIREISRLVTLEQRLPCGVYKLNWTQRAGAGAPKGDYAVFEVLPDDPNGPCPPLASKLPTLVSMPNELKYLEQSALDPWGDFAGFGHCYAIDNRYPAVGNALEIWRMLPVYRRKWWCWNWDRNSNDYDMYGAFNRELVRNADIFGGHDNRRNTQSRYELGVLSYYIDDQLKFLRDFVAERKPPLRKLKLARLEERVAANKPISAEEFTDLFETCWDEFKAYCRPRIEANVQAFTDYILSLNPKVARATYGPYAFYVSHYKTAYTLTYSGYPIEKDPRVRGNGSYWLFEEYHHSCDYPLFRGALFVATYDFNYGYGRRIFPEIYYSGWTRCADGAVYMAHPLSRTSLADTHQRKVAYQYVYGTPQFRNGRYTFWKDYGFHARNPEREAMEQFLYAWGKVIDNVPVRAPKAPVALFDFGAMARNGEYMDVDCSPVYGGQELTDVCNSAEEGLAYVYEQCVVNGYTTPVVSDFGSLDDISADNAEFAILPPIVAGTPPETLAKIRALHARGVNLIATREVVGLENLFGVKRNPSGARKIGCVGSETFENREAKALYGLDGAKPLLFASAEKAGAADIPLVVVNQTRTGRTAFVNAPPASIRRVSFRHVYHWGQDSISEPLKSAVKEAFAYLAPAPAVKSERGLASAAWTEKGELAVILSDESPIYNDGTVYPAAFRFSVRLPDVEKAEIESDAPYAVVSRKAGEIVLRTETDKDTALFFTFTHGKAK